MNNWRDELRDNFGGLFSFMDAKDITDDVADFIQSILDQKAREISKVADEKWMSPPWSGEWNDTYCMIEGYRTAIKELKNDALTILKGESNE